MIRKLLGSSFILLTAFAVARPFQGRVLAASPDIVLYASDATVVTGAWSLVSDTSAAGGSRLADPDAGVAKLASPLANPASYFEMTFTADAGVPYHLWIRGQAQNNYWGNDSVFVQFSGSVTSTGTATWRIGTISGTGVNIEDCSGCGLSGWGWQDNGYGANVLGPDVYFAVSGQQTLRIQPREDGLSIDQIVLSPATYRTASPGALKNDTTIVPKGGATPAATLVNGPYLQQLRDTSVVIVWSTREPGPATAHVSTASATIDVPAATTPLPTTKTGIGFDFYQHEADVSGLSASTTYSYRLDVGGLAVTPGPTDRFTTAPPVGTGSLTFVALGDSGTGSTASQQIAARIASDTFDVALHVGDMAYGNTGGTGPSDYPQMHDWFFGVEAPWLRSHGLLTAIGNHEDDAAHAQPYLDYFVLPRMGGDGAYPDHAERYYSFDEGPVHFVALDTELAFQPNPLDPTDLSRRQAQLAWLDADLAATTQPWRIAFFHRPPYSAGGEHGSDLDVRAAFDPLFEKYGVQLVLSGHEHDYERTIPIRTSTDPNAQAVTYLVSGGGGAPLFPSGVGAWTAYSASINHYLRATVTTCDLSVQAVDMTGTVFDRVALSRCSAPPPSTDIVVYAADLGAGQIIGDWSLVTDTTAANGIALSNPDRGAAKVASAAASPASFVDVPISPAANVPYHLWMRMKAARNNTSNDSVYVQFDHAIDANGGALWPIGSTSGASVILEDRTSAGVAAWGWNDDGWASLGRSIVFDTAGPQRLRIQVREDGVAIDQIVLSPSRYLTTSPGALKNDTTVVPKP